MIDPRESALVALVALAGCGIESLDPPFGLNVPRGAVELQVEQTGGDPRRYAFDALVDGTNYGPITPGAALTVGGLDAEREHGAWLGGAPANCSVPNQQVFRVRDDETTPILFYVACD